MNFKSLIILLGVFCSTMLSYSQEDINHYKYIIIPTKYDFLKEADQYQLNSLTKFLFNKYGYKAYFNNENLPSDLQNNRCLALFAEVEEDKSLFKTKLKINLKDCNSRLVMSSVVGQSREKEFKKAYNFALRDAFTTYQELDYKYDGKSQAPVKAVVSTETAESILKIKQLEEEVKVLKEKNEAQVIEQKEVKIAVKETPITDIPNQDPKQIIESNKHDIVLNKALFAQRVAYGYQVVDLTPKVVMKLLKTALVDVYIVKDQNAIVFKKEGHWYLSSYEGNTETLKELDIKF